MLDAEVPRLNTGDGLGDWIIELALTPGMPMLYRAHHKDDPEKIATIKVIRKSVEAINMLRREVRILRGLHHPAIPKVYDFGFSQIENGVWIAQEHFEGGTLADRLRQDAMDWRVACRVFHQLAGGLREAHNQGIVHQNVVPEAVLLGYQGRVQFGDFDDALEATDLERSSTEDFGPLGYAAPELVDQSRSPRSDIYSLGVMLFEVIAHRSAFPATVHADRASQLEFLRWKKDEAPLLDPGEHVPLWLVNLIQKSTEADAERRLPDAEAFLGWLDAARDSWEAPAPVEKQSAGESTEPPPVIMMVQPSIGAEPVPVLVRGDVPPPPHPLAGLTPMLYMAAAVLGVVTGLAVGILVIVWIEMPAVG